MSHGIMTSAKKIFHLDPDILSPGGTATVELGSATDSDVVIATASNKTFPLRPNGIIDLSHISLTASTGNHVEFEAGDVSLAFDFGASIAAGVGIFDRPDDAMRALDLGDDVSLDLAI